jgi:hypothetical protein
MNEHLTAEEISEFVAGAASPAIGEHLHGCLACRSEAERLTDALALFRQSVRQWSLEPQRLPATLPSGASSRGVALKHLAWTAALAACLIAGLTLPHGKGIKPAPARQTISDADLLVQVDRELSEAVAPSMEPIALQVNGGRK